MATEPFEMHVIGQIASGRDIISDITEGVYCSWMIIGPEHVQGTPSETFQNTQVGYVQECIDEDIIFNHPIDVQYSITDATNPRIIIKCYKLDWHSRSIFCGYGFSPIPLTPGRHEIQIPLWQPVKNDDSKEALQSFLLGCNPEFTQDSFITDESIRNKVVTTSIGSISVEAFVVLRK